MKNIFNIPGILTRTDADEIADYLSDASNYRGASEAVFFPETTEELISLVRAASSKKIPVTCSATRTSLTGSSVPDSGVVINTSRMNKILSFDKERKRIELQPGFILKDLKELCAENKLFYPPDPTEELCTIGGNAATNASGAKSFKFGPTRKYIVEIEIVLAGGEVLRIKRGETFAKDGAITLCTLSNRLVKVPVREIGMPDTKNAAGYFLKNDMDAIDLFIGSEGTLGIITRLTLQLLDAPDSILSCVAYFNSAQDALNFISEARILSREKVDANREAGINARALEFFDNYSLKFLGKDFPLVPSCEAAVWFEQEYDDTNSEEIFSEWDKLMSKHNALAESWFAENEAERKEISLFRHAISYKVNEYIREKGLRKVGTDVAVPDESFNTFFFVIRNLVEARGITFVTYGHFGNSHIHLNMLPADDSEYITAKELYYKICDEAVKLGGTVSAEHGIGKLKREYLKLMYTETEIESMRAVKKALDPHNILCPGNIFI